MLTSFAAVGHERAPSVVEAEPPVGAAADDVAVVIVLPIVLPVAPRADLLTATFVEGAVATARTGVPLA